jgi:excisionase family DNA binding protein
VPETSGAGDGAGAHETQRNAANPHFLAATFAATFLDRGSLLTVAEAAALLSCSTYLVYRLCAAGELQCCRLATNAVRIARADLEAFVQRRGRQRS